MDAFLAQLPQLLINGLTLGAVYALVALGYSMVYGVLQLLNFAHGDVYMVGAYIGFGVMVSLIPADGPLLAPVLIIILMMLYRLITMNSYFYYFIRTNIFYIELRHREPSKFKALSESS